MADYIETDLSIHKTASDYTPQYGDEVTWTVTISNDGKGSAENVRVDQMLPKGMEFVSSQVTSGHMDSSDGIWTIGDLDVGQQVTATVTMIVSVDEGYINNYATVSTDTHDCKDFNDQNTIAIAPWKPTDADLSLIKTVDNPEPEVGEIVEWTVAVHNSGPDTAWNTNVTETLPDGLTFEGARASSGTYDFESGVWNVGHLADGESAEMVISTRVDNEAAMQYVNTAVAASNTADDDYSNNEAEATITVVEAVEPEVAPVEEAQEMPQEMPEEMQQDTPEMQPGPKPEEGGDTGYQNSGHGNNSGHGGHGGHGSNGGHGSHGGHGHSGHGSHGPHHGMGHGGSGMSQGGHGMQQDGDATCVACLCDCDVEKVDGADLQIIKLVDNPTPNLNGEVVWTIVVTNNGPEDAENVVVNDNLPAGVEYVSDSATMGEFDEAAGVWEIGDLANGESVMLQITSIATDAAAVQTNIALVSSDTEDSNPENNVAMESIDAVDADLGIIKTVDNETPDLGEEVVWTILVTNDGPDTAENVVITDALPEGTTFVSSSNEDFDAVSGTLALGGLGAGEFVSVDITVTVDDADGARVNVASVSSDTFDSNPDNNQDDAEVDAVAADLMIDKSVDNSEPNLGEEVVWTIEVTNNGPDTAENVVVTEAQPEGTTLVEPVDERLDVETGEITLGDLESGETVSIELTVTVDDAEGARVNTASVSSDTFDDDDSNNTAEAETDAVAADLGIEKTVDNETPNLGEEVVWTIEVVNNGPDTAENVVVADLLPAGTTFVEASDERFVEESGEIELGDLASGETAEFTITVTVDDADGPQVNTATVSSDTFDNNPDNNEDDAEVDAIAADLMIDKSVDNSEPNLGEEVVWTIDVTNNGPDTAENVVVTEAQPEGTTLVEPVDERLNVETGEITLGDLESGETVSIELTVTVDDAEGARVNTASVSSDTFDNDDSNNSAEAVTDAVAADLSIEKTVNNETPNLGEQIVWTIEVENNGPDTAENVVVADLLPAGTTFFEASDERFVEESGEIELGDLASGETAEFTITVTVDDADGPQINTATVSSDTFDNNPDNNEDNAQVDAVAADLELVKEVLPTIAATGDVVEWTLTVTNQGPDAATGVEVQDILPAGVTYVADSLSGEAPHIAFLGDSWFTLNEPASAIVQPVIEFYEATRGTVTSDNFSVDGNTAAEALAETVVDFRTGLTDTVAETILVSFGVNEFIEGTTPTQYEEDLVELFEELATVSPSSDVVFFIPAETAQVDPVAEWSEYVAAATAATEIAGVTTIDLGQTIPAFAEDPTLWADANHIGEQAVEAVTEALTDGFSVPVSESAFDVVEGVWAVGDLAVGETATLTISAEVVDTGELTNVAEIIASDQVDPDSIVNNDDGDQSEDDEDNAVLTVPVIDLALEQVITNGNTEITSALQGDQVTFEITVTNEGDTTATGVTVSTELQELASDNLLVLGESTESLDFDNSTGILDIGTLEPGASVTLAVDAIITSEAIGLDAITNNAQVATADQDDIDSTPANNDPDEDDQEAVTLEVSAPEPVPVAVDEAVALTVTPQLLNAVIMVDHSGSMGTRGDHPDFFSTTFGTDLEDADGNLTSRLELIRDAVVEFAGYEQIGSIKVLAFSTEAGRDGEVSPWFNVTGPGSEIGAVDQFVTDIEVELFTNYDAALEASAQFFETNLDGSPDLVPNPGPVNFYFLTDGEPRGNGDVTLEADDQEAWETFVNAPNTYDLSYGIGFGPTFENPINFPQLDIVSHPDNASVSGEINGEIRDEENTLIAREANEIPAVLQGTITETVTGNVLENDDFGDDLAAGGSPSISSVIIDGTTYSYDGSDVTITDGPTPDGLLIRSGEGSINVALESQGRLDLDFSNGDYEYFAPFTTTQVTDVITYEIVDGSGDRDSATLTFTVTAPIETAATDEMPVEETTTTDVSLLSDDDDLFASGTMGIVQLPESSDNEWASNGDYHQDDMYDVLSLVV